MFKLPRYGVILLFCNVLASTPVLKVPYKSAIHFPSSEEETIRPQPPALSSLPLLVQDRIMPVSSNDVDDRGRYRVASEAVHGVATRLHAVLDPSGLNNYVISPLSIAAIVGQLMLGAKGPTQHRLRQLLSATRPSAQDPNATTFDQQLHLQLGGLLQQLQRVVQTEDNYYQLRAASSFFMQTNLQVYKRFFDDIKKLYKSDIYSLDFRQNPLNAYLSVNDWVSTNTGGLITNILSAPLPPRTAALFVNTIYFRADWLTPFSSDLTIDGKFQANSTHQTNVRYLRGQFELKFAESDELKCRMIIMPYKQKDVNMYVVLPNREIGDDVKNFANTLTWRNVATLVKSSKEYTTTVVLPKMKLQNTFSLKEPIMNYRPVQSRQQMVFDSFNNTPYRAQSVPVRPTKQPIPNKAPLNTNNTINYNPSSSSNFDLSNVSPDERFQLEQILHRVSLEVSERGTEAAAVSIGSVDYTLDIKSFKVDRPFVFFIRHEPSLVNLFWGVIMDPSAGN